MIQFSKFALSATFGLAMALTLSCSSDDGGGNPTPSGLRKEKISGVSQKGPFAEGTTVKIYELDTITWGKGSLLSDTTTDGSGKFKIENVTLASPYIFIEVYGKYLNEVNGQQTTTPITLIAVADVQDKNKSTVNINVFTHLEYGKVLKLAKSMEFGEAKKAAQKEVLNALGMSEVSFKSSEDLSLYGDRKSDSLLLAASVLLQGNRSATEVSSLLGTIGSEIRDKGVLSTQTKSQVASDLAFLVGNDNVGKNILDFANIIVAGMNFTDSRDNKVYKLVKIGNQTWMAENLNYNAANSRCYSDNPANCAKYGRLYDWATAKTICPSGWHLPSKTEWAALITAVGGEETAGTKLKSANDWNHDGVAGTNNFGFSALPGGYGDSNGFDGVGNYGRWWSADVNNSNAYYMGMSYDGNGANVDDDFDGLLSVRCLQ